MALQLYLIWYFIMGSLMGNGVPHFVFGAARKVFKSPFGQRSKPRVNVLWGLYNFVLATAIAIGLVAFNRYSAYALPAMLLGFWLMMLMFGLRIKKFLNEPK
jgi:cobalamin biosynthesis protein CobD/CbiB